MYVRLLRIKTSINRIDEAAGLFKGSVIPLCKTQKGYKGAYFLTDRRTGASMPITLWESEEDMIANEESRFFQEQVAKFVGLFSAPPIRESYEVIFQD